MMSHEIEPDSTVMVTPGRGFAPINPNPDLLRSLRRLVRGLSALFWGLPVALILCVEAVKTDMLLGFNIVPPVVATAWLVFGLWQLGGFQKQERIWVRALDRAKLLAIANLGFSPFIYWASRVPDQLFFTTVVQIMALTSLLFLDSLNVVLNRLSAMLPDENLRQETRQFTALNRLLVLGIVLFGLCFAVLLQHPEYLPAVGNYITDIRPQALWVMLFLVLLPLAITMALIWKTKAVILDSVFGA